MSSVTLAVLDPAVRRLEEAVVVGARVDRQRVDEADVRAFRRLDRADATVVGRVHVADFEAGALARQAARAECGDAALVGDLGERVVLVHELRELRGAEELLHRGRDRLRVDHVLRHQAFALGDRQALLDGALDADEADAERVLGHFTDAADAAVAEVVDVVDRAVAVADVDQRAQHVDDVGGLAELLDQALGEVVAAALEVQHVVEDAGALGFLAADAAVELHPAHGRQVVALGIEEQVLEQVLGRIARGRLARAHHAVDLDQRFHPVLGRVDAQRVGDERAAVEVVDVEHADLGDPGLHQLEHRGGGEDLVGLGQDLAGLGVDDVVREHLADQVFARHGQAVEPGVFHLPHVARGDAAAFLDDDLAVAP